MKRSAVLVVCGMFLLSSCAVRQPGKRTFEFGPDGQTITSDTTTADGNALADIEKEKTRQVCYKQLNAKRTKMSEEAEKNPVIYALIAQTDAINNLASLAVTRKNYDPCPSSTNQADVEIADAAMYSSIYKGAFDFAKTGLMVWGGVEIADSIFSAIGKGAASYSFNASGDESSIAMTDAFKTSTLGNIGADNQLGGIFGNNELPKTTTTNTESFNTSTAEPFVFSSTPAAPVTP